jgi:Ring finger domain
MDCPVCLLSIERGARIDCGHTFHFPCITKWTNLNPTCPLCKQSVTEIVSEFAIKYVSPPKVGYDVTISGYLYGPPRRHIPHIPYENQPDLPGFVLHETSDEILAREGRTANGREEVPLWPHLSHSDLRPVYTRTRSRGSKHVT